MRLVTLIAALWTLAAMPAQAGIAIQAWGGVRGEGGSPNTANGRAAPGGRRPSRLRFKLFG